MTRKESLIQPDWARFSDQSNFSLAVAQVILLTSSSFVGVREETYSLKTFTLTHITSNSSELDQANNMLSAISEEAPEQGSA